MSTNKSGMTGVVVAAVIALGVGVALGVTLANKGVFSGGSNAIPVVDKDLPNKSVEELCQKLSEHMLPEDEFAKLDAAILQAGMGLLMAQAQQAGVTVSDAVKDKLKETLSQKYSREYFAKLNADSMKELNKDELIAIISFYGTEAGKKFLGLSPEIIKTTMMTVQQDLGTYLPKAVEELVAELKGGSKTDNKEEAAPAKHEG